MSDRFGNSFSFGEVKSRDTGDTISRTFYNRLSDVDKERFAVTGMYPLYGYDDPEPNGHYGGVDIDVFGLFLKAITPRPRKKTRRPPPPPQASNDLESILTLATVVLALIVKAALWIARATCLAVFKITVGLTRILFHVVGALFKLVFKRP